MLADLLINPDFKAFMAEVEGLHARRKDSLESAKSWEEVVRTQGAISALRTVLDLPQHLAMTAARAEEAQRSSVRRTKS